MTFQPVVPFSGLTGWRFLQRTLVTQQETFAASAPQKRAADYFREKIGTTLTADALVADRRLLEVALTAFGLEDDLNNKAFIRKILDDGTLDPEALGNKLADKRYLALTKAFGFGDFDTPRTVLSTFSDEILDRYAARSFESAVGDQNDDMRLALNVSDGLAEVLDSSTSENARWFAIMGSPPLLAVFKTAFGFPPSFSQMNLDRQLTALKDRSESLFGSSQVATFADPKQQDKLIRNFLVRSEAAAGAQSSSGSVALALLQSAASFYR